MKKTHCLSLDEVEQKRYKAFVNLHYKKHHFRGGAPVTITPTGVGDIVVVKCPSCGNEKDISNYEVW